MTEPLQIIATDVLYYHDADERAFFEWLDRMAFVADYRGEVRDLFINLNRLPTDDDMFEIIGFCRRYGINMAQLAKFETPENTVWLRDNTMIWHREIFGGLSEASDN
ncbi:MAG: hypothetical protein E2586_18800 [Novosphingobium sp.]|uniref:hypothetical protein n=1 Tax=Novosphingobium sp. TaxID=1874826 RepID=UPI0012CFDD86|nr:hypothetical protein [Novosphingobium sp.]MPS70533.1 hypothetical protein [Novosphingobium sp.]